MNVFLPLVSATCHLPSPLMQPILLYIVNLSIVWQQNFGWHALISVYDSLIDPACCLMSRAVATKIGCF